MAQELSYVLITPYSLRKSRTGGIISRLLSRTGLDLVAGRMFAPSKALAEAYAEVVVGAPDPRHEQAQRLVQEYVRKNFAPDAEGNRQRVLMLVLRGEDAIQKTRSVTGYIVSDRPNGQTIRDTYGDFISENGKVVYFEPAVLAAPDAASAGEHLALWAAHSDSDGGILEDCVLFPAGVNVETTLVLIKPDNFRFPNARPGGVIDVLSRSGLAIIGFKVHHMSLAQATEFYGPVLETLNLRMRVPAAKRARLAIERELGFPLDAPDEDRLADLVGPLAARDRWESIVQFMCGARPSQCPAADRELPGTEKIIALVYRGIDAVSKIREILGPTDPEQAPPGSIRREFGQSAMINAAHASDSQENARREMKILHLEENNLKPLLEGCLNPS